MYVALTQIHKSSSPSSTQISIAVLRLVHLERSKYWYDITYILLSVIETDINLWFVNVCVWDVCECVCRCVGIRKKSMSSALTVYGQTRARDTRRVPFTFKMFTNISIFTSNPIEKNHTIKTTAFSFSLINSTHRWDNRFFIVLFKI